MLSLLGREPVTWKLESPFFGGANMDSCAGSPGVGFLVSSPRILLSLSLCNSDGN